MQPAYRVYFADFYLHPELDEDYFIEVIHNGTHFDIHQYWSLDEEFNTEEEAYAYAERHQDLLPLITTDDEYFYF